MVVFSFAFFLSRHLIVRLWRVGTIGRLESDLLVGNKDNGGGKGEGGVLILLKGRRLFRSVCISLTDSQMASDKFLDDDDDVSTQLPCMNESSSLTSHFNNNKANHNHNNNNQNGKKNQNKKEIKNNSFFDSKDFD